MPLTYLEISQIHSRVISELDRLVELDRENQNRFPQSISQLQLETLTESVFFYSFRAYENFLEDAFISYILGGESLSGETYDSYINPNDFEHAYELLKSDMPFLEWTGPDNVIRRSELLFIDDGAPFKIPISSEKNSLQNMRTLRNHIAHNSRSSNQKFLKMIRTYNSGIAPLNPPSPGEHLNSVKPRIRPSTVYLHDYISVLRNIIETITV